MRWYRLSGPPAEESLRIHITQQRLAQTEVGLRQALVRVLCGVGDGLSAAVSSGCAPPPGASAAVLRFCGLPLLLRGGAHGLLQVLHGIVDTEVVVVVVLIDGLEDLRLQLPGLVLQGVLPEQILYGFADLPDLVLVVDIGLQFQILDVAPDGVPGLCQRGIRPLIPLGLGMSPPAPPGNPGRRPDSALRLPSSNSQTRQCSPLFAGGRRSARLLDGPIVPDPVLCFHSYTACFAELICAILPV